MPGPIAFRSSSINRVRTGVSHQVKPDGSIATVKADEAIGCAWPVQLPAGSETPFLPDLHTTYQALGLRFSSNRNGSNTLGKPDEVYRIRARYPLVRYFSYQSYDLRGQNVQEILDVDIKPSSGKNPFSDPSIGDTMDIGTYEIYISKYGGEGHPNEIAALAQGSKSLTSLVVLRLLAHDPQSDDDDAEWGGVDAPIVELLDRRTGEREQSKNFNSLNGLYGINAPLSR